MFRGKARRRRENFEDLALKIIDFMKKIDEKRLLIPQNFLGAFGADSYTYLVHPIDYLKPPLVVGCREQGVCIRLTHLSLICLDV